MMPKPVATSVVQTENQRRIVTEWRFAPGAETTWHRHQYDYIVVPQTTGTLRIETREGEKLAQLKAGQAYTRVKGVEHNVVNESDNEFVFIEIELK
jgi:quercetin dioxygenase-like cupin family protein